MPVRSYFLHALFWKRMNLCSFVFHRTESSLKVSLAHMANYWDGFMYNGSMGMVCPTHILDEKVGSSEPS